MRRTGLRLGIAAGLVASLVACQLPEDEPPDLTGPSEASVPGDPEAVLGSPASPEPTPSPEAEAPEPTPPNPAPASGSCSLPPSNPSSAACTDARPLLANKVEAALDAVTDRFPDLFDFNDRKCENCYFVRDPSRYFDEVIRQLNRQDLCTDGVREELGVKSSNDFSEQYDVLLASGHMRRAPSSYRGVCRPAIF
jgi:hypothetical protein